MIGFRVIYSEFGDNLDINCREQHKNREVRVRNRKYFTIIIIS